MRRKILSTSSLRCEHPGCIYVAVTCRPFMADQRIGATEMLDIFAEPFFKGGRSIFKQAVKKLVANVRAFAYTNGLQWKKIEKVELTVFFLPMQADVASVLATAFPFTKTVEQAIDAWFAP